MTTTSAPPGGVAGATDAGTGAETRRQAPSATGGPVGGWADWSVRARALGRRGRWSVVLPAAVVVAAGLLASVQPMLVLGLGAVLLVLGVTARQPAALPAAAVPLLLVVNRLGGDAGAGLSISDFVLFAAFWPAVLFCRRPFSPEMRRVMWANAFYQAMTLLTVVANPYLANGVEWLHAWLLVGGALVVGWAVGAAGLARVGLGMYVAACAVLAVVTCSTALMQMAVGNFGPVYLGPPFLMHKNFIGCVLAFGAIIVYTRPRWLRWNDLACLVLFALLTAGILASQSRQALVGLAVAVAVVALRPDPHRYRSKFVLVAIGGLAVVVATLVQDQLESGDQYNSAYQRLTWFAQSMEVWAEYPLFGAGLRWWYTDRFDFQFQPPNAEFEALSSTGTVGLAAFLIMFAAILAVLWRLDVRFGTLAFVAVLMRFVQGQFDLFWVAAQVSIPFVIAGICLGAADHVRRVREETGADVSGDVEAREQQSRRRDAGRHAAGRSPASRAAARAVARLERGRHAVPGRPEQEERQDGPPGGRLDERRAGRAGSPADRDGQMPRRAALRGDR